MAGEKQHHIPRLLMRGFKRLKEDAERVYLYRTGEARTHIVNINDINQQKYFFSGPEDTSLDDAITKEEGLTFGPVLHMVRTDEPLTGSDEHILRRFLVHMILRTESARTFVNDLAGNAMNGLKAAVSDADTLTQGIENDAFDMQAIAQRAVSESTAELASRGIHLPPFMQQMLIEKSVAFARSNAASMGAKIAEMSQVALQGMPIPQSATGSAIQRKTLSQDLAPQARVAELNAFALSIERVADELILSDDPVLAFDAQGHPQRALVPDNPAVLYCLPASSHHLIALRQSGSASLPTVERLNVVSAAQSRRHFLARNDRADFLALIARIGSFKGAGEQTDWAAFFKESLIKRD